MAQFEDADRTSGVRGLDPGHQPAVLIPSSMRLSLWIVILITTWFSTLQPISVLGKALPLGQKRHLQVMWFFAPPPTLPPGETMARRLLSVKPIAILKQLSQVALIRRSTPPLSIPYLDVTGFSFVDAYHFEFSNAEIVKSKKKSRHNLSHDFEYHVTPLRWSETGYEIRLSARGQIHIPDVVLEGSFDQAQFFVKQQKTTDAVVVAVLVPVTPQRGIENEVLEPRLKNRVDPKFPRELSDKRQEGQVWLEVVIGTDGRVENDGYILIECPHRLFGINALAAVQQWEFFPATKSGTPVRRPARVSINYQYRGR